MYRALLRDSNDGPTRRPRAASLDLLLCLWTALVLGGSVWAAADTPPSKFAAAGPEFQVNSYTPGNQVSPAVGISDSGSFVIVWRGADAADPDLGILGQRFGADGNQVGAEFPVNTYTTGVQNRPALGIEPDGDFVVVWESSGSDGTDSSGASIQGRRFASDGSPRGAQFQVNTYTSMEQTQASIAVDSDGSFVVVWTSEAGDDSDSDAESIQGQRFGTNGLPVGGPFQINTYTTGSQSTPDVAMDGYGAFTVVWQSQGSAYNDTDGTSIQGQRFGPSGTAVGGEFQVNTYTTADQTLPAVASAGDGEILVVWESAASDLDTDGTAILGQRFAADGSPLGVEHLVDSLTVGDQTDPDVAMDLGGGATTVHHSADSSVIGPWGRRFTADGASEGLRFRVNDLTQASQRRAAIASNAGGDVIVAWDSFLLANQSIEIRARRYLREADLSITKDDGLAEALSGETLTYTIVASNAGPDWAAPAVVIDSFPLSMTCTWTSVASGGATGNSGGSGTILVEELTLPPSSSATYTVECPTASNFVGTVTNTASLFSTVNDPDSSDTAATDVTEIYPHPKLALTASPSPLATEPGDVVQVAVEVTNTGPTQVTITSLDDQQQGSLDGVGTCSLGAVLAPGASYACTYPWAVAGSIGGQDATTVAIAGSAPGGTAEDEVDADVQLVDILPMALVDKSTATCQRTIEEPGASVTFRVRVRNEGPEALDLQALVDDAHGDLDGQGDCALPQSIPPGGAYACSYAAMVSGAAETKDTSVTTATVEDDEANQDLPTGSATVQIVAPGTIVFFGCFESGDLSRWTGAGS